MEITFSRLIQQILREQGLNLMDLYKELYDLGLKITYPTLYSYYTGTVIPSKSVASEILRLEKSDINDQELDEILKYSKKIFNQEKEDENNLLRLNLKIKPENINIDFKNNSKILKTVIEMRSDELFGDEDLITQFSASGKRKLSAYVAYLIKKDLEESDFIKPEVK